MPKFQGSGFSIVLPEAAIDASSYCFSFPQAGVLAPNLTIKSAPQEERPDLRVLVEEQRKQLSASLDNLRVVSEVASQHESWDYIVSVIEWGPEGGRMRQKQLLVFVPGEKPRLFTLVATDLAENVDNSEPLFDQIIKSFDPNDIQVA